ncbi:hypothetical protein Golob_008914, partial [Gossypium lobatum]|nr:hypothetical protein [Gossypium lobatum]
MGLAHLIVELDALLVVKIRHILREGNKRVDHLSNLAHDVRTGMTCLEEPLPSLQPLLRANACGKGI